MVNPFWDSVTGPFYYVAIYWCPSDGGASVNGNTIKRPRDRIPKGIRIMVRLTFFGISSDLRRFLCYDPKRQVRSNKYRKGNPKYLSDVSKCKNLLPYSRRHGENPKSNSSKSSGKYTFRSYVASIYERFGPSLFRSPNRSMGWWQCEYFYHVSQRVFS